MDTLISSFTSQQTQTWQRCVTIRLHPINLTQTESVLK